MNRSLIIGALCVLLLPAGIARAHLNWGANCATCHSPVTTGGLNINNITSLAVSPRLDAGNSGSLASYNVTAGGTATITLSLNTATTSLAAGDQYMFVISGNGDRKRGYFDGYWCDEHGKGVKNNITDVLPFASSYAGWTRQVGEIIQASIRQTSFISRLRTHSLLTTEPLICRKHSPWGSERPCLPTSTH